MADQPTHDCGHACCDERHDPFHDHFLSVEQCPSCRRLRDLEAAAVDLTASIREAERPSVVDLMEALEASLAAVKEERRRP